MTECNAINPYYVNFVAYFSDTPINPLSKVDENSELFFYVWPKNPCYGASLKPDEEINDGDPITYFLSSTNLYTTIEQSNDTVSLDVNF